MSRIDVCRLRPTTHSRHHEVCVCDVDIIGELLGMSQAPTFIYVKKTADDIFWKQNLAFFLINTITNKFHK